MYKEALGYPKTHDGEQVDKVKSLQNFQKQSLDESLKQLCIEITPIPKYIYEKNIAGIFGQIIKQILEGSLQKPLSQCDVRRDISHFNILTTVTTISYKLVSRHAYYERRYCSYVSTNHVNLIDCRNHLKIFRKLMQHFQKKSSEKCLKNKLLTKFLEVYLKKYLK